MAACLAGVFSEGRGLRLVAERGRLMQEQPGGAMLAVALGEEEVGALAAECGLWVAAVNAPGRCVASGAEAGVARLEERLRELGVEGRRLETSHGFHSGLMEGAVEPLVEAVRAVGGLGAPRVPYVSNVTGRWARAEEACEAGYWGRQMREAVRFGAGLEEALGGGGERVVIEVGPGRGLTSLARRHGAAAGREAAVYASLRGEGEEAADEAVLLEAVGGAWLSGVRVAWGEVWGGGRRRVALPSYPFERRRYWVEAGAGGVGRRGGGGGRRGAGGGGRVVLPAVVAAGAVAGGWGGGGCGPVGGLRAGRRGADGGGAGGVGAARRGGGAGRGGRGGGGGSGRQLRGARRGAGGLRVAGGRGVGWRERRGWV